jgi:hypothetical protein
MSEELRPRVGVLPWKKPSLVVSPKYPEAIHPQSQAGAFWLFPVKKENTKTKRSIWIK